MPKCFYTIVLCFFTVAPLKAQQVKKAAVFFNTGMQFKQKGLFYDAIAAFKKAINLDNKNDSAYLEMAMIYAQINKADSGIILLTNAIKARPAFAGACIVLGNIYRDYKNNQDEAIASYTKALKTDSTNKVTLYSLAWCYNVKKYYREAVNYAIRALQVDNNYKPAYNELGHAYRQLNAYEEAIAQFKKNLTISYNDIPLLYCGYCYLELNQKDEALKVYEELKKTNVKMAEGLKKKIDAKQ